MGIKGGIARKILKIMLGVSKDAPYMKSEVSLFIYLSLIRYYFTPSLPLPLPAPLLFLCYILYLHLSMTLADWR